MLFKIGKVLLFIVAIAAIFVLTVISSVLLRRQISLQSPVTLKETVQTMNVEMTVSRYDSAWVRFPESEYTKDFTLNLDEDFVDFSDPTWWFRVREVLKQLDDFERGRGDVDFFSSSVVVHNNSSEVVKTDEYTFTVKTMPTYDWLAENVERGLDDPFVSLKIFLPKEGDLYRAVDSKDFQFDELYPEEQVELAPMQIIVDERLINSRWKVFLLDRFGHTYFVETWDEVQQDPKGIFVYRFPNESEYIVIQLPEDILKLTEEDLIREDKQFVYTAEVYKR